MQLTSDQVRQIQQALLHAFDRDGLRMLLRLQLNEDLDAVAGDDNLNTVVFNLVAWAEREGRVGELIAGAAAANPGNAQIQQLVHDSQGWAAAAAPRVVPATAPLSAPPSAPLAAPLRPSKLGARIGLAIGLIALLVLAGMAVIRLLGPSAPPPAARPSPTAGTDAQPPAATATRPPQPSAPHAPPLPANGAALYDEKTQLITIPSGGEAPFKVMDYWSAPEGAQPSCASAFLALSWQVRQPFPKGGEEFEIRTVIPMGGGRTDVLQHGARGTATAGWCDELTLRNLSLEEYRVELRYASGMN